ncbi:acetolactate decarboxylase [Thermosynechococcaceae cyanobacterium BACA0444]|uniref:Alpha-acetolactate decarboxylase n=1 Tax=Pseudocalidococcus azoricus BACA0444 TaxID=2918990 RepID=A0AAE4FQ82_9CYAN|nr:acetolactate decarboxylase [Pseudocalidococcus azoricus]MDS3859537.1 acetolactate decarboxylase [Pseudocalidococcus azoricus BACA0444]
MNSCSSISAKLLRPLRWGLWLGIFLAVCVPLVALGAANPVSRGFQISTLDALSAGVFEGAMSFRELRQYGNFGLGTFAGLDGEMIGLDNRFYQVKHDGAVFPVSDQSQTPFAVVTQFKPTQKILLPGTFTYTELQTALDQKLPSLNYPYALKIHGQFPQLELRSVPGQVPPYPTLGAVVKQQTVFNFQQVSATLVGFRLPQNMQGINAAGYHFHGLTQDKKGGGHLLAGIFRNPIVQVQLIQDWHTSFPDTAAFAQSPAPIP